MQRSAKTSRPGAPAGSSSDNKPVHNLRATTALRRKALFDRESRRQVVDYLSRDRHAQL